MPDLARDAPALCAAVLRAVGSDAELRRLERGGDLAGLAARAGALAGAGGRRRPWPRSRRCAPRCGRR